MHCQRLNALFQCVCSQFSKQHRTVLFCEWPAVAVRLQAGIKSFANASSSEASESLVFNSLIEANIIRTHWFVDPAKKYSILRLVYLFENLFCMPTQHTLWSNKSNYQCHRCNLVLCSIKMPWHTVCIVHYHGTLDSDPYKAYKGKIPHGWN